MLASDHSLEQYFDDIYVHDVFFELQTFLHSDSFGCLIVCFVCFGLFVFFGVCVNHGSFLGFNLNEAMDMLTENYQGMPSWGDPGNAQIQPLRFPLKNRKKTFQVQISHQLKIKISIYAIYVKWVSYGLYKWSQPWILHPILHNILVASWCSFTSGEGAFFSLHQEFVFFLMNPKNHWTPPTQPIILREDILCYNSSGTQSVCHQQYRRMKVDPGILLEMQSCE